MRLHFSDPPDGELERPVLTGLAEGSLVLLDACCLINLIASGRMDEILRSVPCRFSTSRLVVAKEILSAARVPGANSPIERESPPQDWLESLDCLSILDLSSDDDFANFVGFAAELDDGEASVCALALSQAGAVATDDRKALRLLERKFPQVPRVQTPEIFYEWARFSKASEDEVGRVLRTVQVGARFHPRWDAPRFGWWDSLCTRYK